MTRDPIVAEIHRIRAQIWEECGRDIDTFFERLKAAEAKHKDRLVSSIPRPQRPARPGR